MEKKKVTGGAVKEAAAKVNEPVVRKELTYDELKDYAKQLSMQAQRMSHRIMELEEMVNFKRLDYLFKVVEYPIQFPEDFVRECVEEIVTIMTIKPEQEEPQK